MIDLTLGEINALIGLIKSDMENYLNIPCEYTSSLIKLEVIKERLEKNGKNKNRL